MRVRKTRRKHENIGKTDWKSNNKRNKKREKEICLVVQTTQPLLSRPGGP